MAFARNYAEFWSGNFSCKLFIRRLIPKYGDSIKNNLDERHIEDIFRTGVPQDADPWGALMLEIF